MRLAYKALTSTFLYLAISSVSYAQPTETPDPSGDISGEFNCYEQSKLSMPFSVCYRDAQYTNSDDIVYFLHDADSTEKDWFKSAKGFPQVQGIWDRAGYRPRIVTVSFGRRKILVRNIGTKEHLFFLKEAIPFLENEMGGLRNGKRHIVGQSTGAISASNLAFRKEVQFNSVSLLCPALTDLNPYSTEKQVMKYIEDNRLNGGLVVKNLKLQQENYISAWDWDMNYPTLLMSKFGPKLRPAIYVSAGGDNGAGFAMGTETFVQAAKRMGYHPTWEPTNGPHCSYREQGFAKFILEQAQ